MHNFSVEISLRRKLKKLYKKDKKTYLRVMSKIHEVILSPSVEHYKNLKKPLQYLKSVHVMKSFVLVFEYSRKEDCINFYDFDHHDKIYK